MMDSAIILSTTSTYRFMNALEKSFPNEMSLSKGAALLFDIVYVNVDKVPLDSFREAFTDGLTNKGKETISRIFQPLSKKSSSNFSVSELLNKSISEGVVERSFVEEKIKQLNDNLYSNSYTDPNDPVGGDINPLYGLILSLIYDLPYYEAKDRLLPFKSFANDANGNIYENKLEFSVPSFDSFSWNDIFEIRQDPRWKDFSNVIIKSDSISEIKDEILQQAMDVFRGIRTNESSIWTRLISLLPVGMLPVPNPLSVYREASEFKDQTQRNKNFSFLYFTDELREKANKANSHGKI